MKYLWTAKEVAAAAAAAAVSTSLQLPQRWLCCTLTTAAKNQSKRNSIATKWHSAAAAAAVYKSGQNTLHINYWQCDKEDFPLPHTERYTVFKKLPFSYFFPFNSSSSINLQSVFQWTVNCTVSAHWRERERERERESHKVIFHHFLSYHQSFSPLLFSLPLAMDKSGKWVCMCLPEKRALYHSSNCSMHEKRKKAKKGFYNVSTSQSQYSWDRKKWTTTKIEGEKAISGFRICVR